MQVTYSTHKPKNKKRKEGEKSLARGKVDPMILYMCVLGMSQRPYLQN